MEYLEVKIICDESFRDIIIAELDDTGYDSFWETEVGVNAYIARQEYDEELLRAVLQKYATITSINFTAEDLKERNWNEEWEKNYDPIVVEDQVFVGASFHQAKQQYPYNILINPRMSFGTGHHETTYLMLAQQLEINHQDKRVLDIGCGTGILAIMAALKGAGYILAVDNNDWAVNNCRDNIEQNKVNVELSEGTIDIVTPQKFDIILANINRNVLLEEAGKYTEFLNDDGLLVLSGFYTHDVADIAESIENTGFHIINQKQKNNWASVKFSKI